MKSTQGGVYDGITLYFKAEDLTFSNDVAHKELALLGVNGCNHMVSRLKGCGKLCLAHLPERLDHIHLQLAGVGPRTVEKFWNELKMLSNLSSLKPSYEDGKLYIHYNSDSIMIPKQIYEKEIELRFFPANISSTIETMRKSGIYHYNDLPANLNQLDLPGVGNVKLNNFFHSLQEAVESTLDEERVNQLSDEERVQYEMENYLSWYDTVTVAPHELKKDKISPIYIRLVRNRYYASFLGEHVTLEKLGNELGVTRERIRQIFKKGDTQIITKWKKLCSLIVNKLNHTKMIIVDDIDIRIEAHFLLIHALEEKGIFYETVGSISFLTAKSKRQLSEYMETIKRDINHAFSKQIVTVRDVENFCENRASEDGSPKEIVMAIISDEINWLAKDQGMIKNMTKSDIVEMVMLQYPQGVEIYKREHELIQKANKLMPGAFDLERSFNAIVVREDLQHTFYMWGRGKAIHANFVSVDAQWMHAVIEIALVWLANEEFIHIRKLYAEVKDEAEKQGVPNEYALYTLIRLHAKDALSLPRFPNVLPYGEDRLENHEWIVRFLKNKSRPVSVAELVEEFVEKKGWKRFTLDYNLSNSSEIIPYGHGIHTLAAAYADVDKEKLQTIIAKLTALVNEQKLLYFPSFYSDHERDLNRIGIPNAYVLYGLLRNENLSGIEFPRLPYVVAYDFEGDTTTISQMIEEFVREENRVVARSEINYWLNDMLGEGNKLLDVTLQHTEKILYYSHGQNEEYIHRDTIQLESKNIKVILNAISTRFNKKKNIFDRNYVFITELFIQEKLPALPQSIEWNEELLADILKKSNEWRFIGSYNKILTPVEDGISNDIDFVEFILQNEFYGAVELAEIKAFLKEIKYSKDGDFLFEVKEAMGNGDTPFEVVGDELVHLDQLEGSVIVTE